MPRHGAQICAQAPTRGFVQTGALAQALGMVTKSEVGLILAMTVVGRVKYTCVHKISRRCDMRGVPKIKARKVARKFELHVIKYNILHVSKKL